MQIIFILFAAATTIQVIYFILFLIAFSKKPKPASDEPNLPVSVLVCAHDEESNIKELIPLLLQQDYPEFEIILIDDRSNDGTFDWLLSETKKDHRLRMVHINRTPPHANGKKYAITLGIRAARFDWVLLTDADCRPTGRHWIQSMSKGFEDQSRFVLGYSPYQKLPGLLNLFIRFETLITAVQYFSFALLGYPYMGVGRNLAYRKSFFMEKKGFNGYLNVTGGDDDLFVNRHATRANTRVQLGAESSIDSIPTKTWRAFFRQKVRHLSVGKLYRYWHRIFLGLFSTSWMAVWVLAIVLLAFNEMPLVVCAMLLFRIVLAMMTVYSSSKRLGQRFEVWSVPFLDFIYVFYYLVTGLVALGSNKVRWKN